MAPAPPAPPADPVEEGVGEEVCWRKEATEEEEEEEDAGERGESSMVVEPAESRVKTEQLEGFLSKAMIEDADDDDTDLTVDNCCGCCCCCCSG